MSLRTFLKKHQGSDPSSPPEDALPPSALHALREQLYQRMLDAVDIEGSQMMGHPESLKDAVHTIVRDTLRQEGLEARCKHLTAQLEFDLLADVSGYGPLQHLMDDPSVSDILVNGKDEIWVDRGGVLQLTDVRFFDDRHLIRILDRMVASHGRHLEEATPYADIRLEDGSRLHAIIPPLSQRGPVLSIRRKRKTPLQLQDLIASNALTPSMADFLITAIRDRKNILVSGGATTGKTTLLNILGGFIPPHERVITIEETLELEIDHPHIIPLESRPSSVEGRGEIDLRILVKNALRMRADRIVIGEVRGREVFDMLQAMNVGHPGSMTTLHANHPQDALRRLETLLLLSGIDLPGDSLHNLVALSFNVIVQLDRNARGQRWVSAIVEVKSNGTHAELHPLYTHSPAPSNQATSEATP